MHVQCIAIVKKILLNLKEYAKALFRETAQNLIRKQCQIYRTGPRNILYCFVTERTEMKSNLYDGLARDHIDRNGQQCSTLEQCTFTLGCSLLTNQSRQENLNAMIFFFLENHRNKNICLNYKDQFNFSRRQFYMFIFPEFISLRFYFTASQSLEEGLKTLNQLSTAIQYFGMQQKAKKSSTRYI